MAFKLLESWWFTTGLCPYQEASGISNAKPSPRPKGAALSIVFPCGAGMPQAGEQG